MQGFVKTCKTSSFNHEVQVHAPLEIAALLISFCNGCCSRPTEFSRFENLRWVSQGII
jgi:hypothetical protein